MTLSAGTKLGTYEIVAPLGAGGMGAAVEPGNPVALFQTRIWGGGTNANQNQQYDVAPDGRFLTNIAAEDASAAPSTLLLNWKPD
ncbi:MAG: hypothetical protein HYU27_03795 [Acidobacteria bacterium]|nr:hypothetical protein [Acidobacteriota bacterium]